jgi:hypothetical protein
MLARRLTSSGLEQFQGWLAALKTDAAQDAPLELLSDPQSSAAIDVEIDAEPRSFHSRLEVAEHLQKILRADAATLRTDGGFWSWLALYWFEWLCPTQDGKWHPGESARWIAELEDPRRACRHLLAGPYQILRAHRDDPSRALSLLCGRPDHLSPLVTLIASRPSLVTCPAVVGAATRLYYEQAKGRNRPGLNARDPGSPRRFADILQQLDLTWDLYSLTTQQLLDLLPPEFDEFRRPCGRQRPLIE